MTADSEFFVDIVGWSEDPKNGSFHWVECKNMDKSKKLYVDLLLLSSI